MLRSSPMQLRSLVGLVCAHSTYCNPSIGPADVHAVFPACIMCRAKLGTCVLYRDASSLANLSHQCLTAGGSALSGSASFEMPIGQQLLLHLQQHWEIVLSRVFLSLSTHPHVLSSPLKAASSAGGELHSTADAASHKYSPTPALISLGPSVGRFQPITSLPCKILMFRVKVQHHLLRHLEFDLIPSRTFVPDTM